MSYFLVSSLAWDSSLNWFNIEILLNIKKQNILPHIATLFSGVPNYKPPQKATWL